MSNHPAPERMITLLFSGFPPVRSEAVFRMKKNAFLSMPIRSYRDRAGLPMLMRTVFVYNNHRIRPGDTPLSLGMKDNDTVEVHEERTYVAYVEKFRDKHPVSKRSRRLIEDMTGILERAESSDISIKTSCDGKIFRVHSLILTARSSVFRAMLDTEMVEAAKKEIVISDIDSDTVKEMIKFIYTGELSDRLDLQCIWYAADKYDVNGLQEEICSKMKNCPLRGVDLADMFLIRQVFICFQPFFFLSVLLYVFQT